MTSEFGIAVHALVYLSHMGGSLSSEKLAVNICTNPARVRKVMAQLKKAGLVETKEGTEGGYAFRKDPRKVTLRQVSCALNTRFVSAGWRSGDADMDCLIASGMADVMDKVYKRLDSACQSQLEQITVAAIEQEIFHKREK